MGRARGPVISYYRATLVSLFIGAVIGLGIGWVLLPVQFTNADPADLQLSYKDDYIRMISAAFELDGNVSRASLRLSQLGLGTLSQAINEFITREGKVSKNAKNVAAAADLARALTSAAGARPTSVPTSSSGKSAPAIQGASPTEALATFRLVERTPLSCSDEPDQAHLRIYARDANGKELANVGIQVYSDKGEDIIYTGLKPEHGIGYADLVVTPNTYSATVLGSQADPATALQIDDPNNCKSDQGTKRGWKLVFQKQ